MTREYIIYCDESEAAGNHYSNFYGGALVRSDHIDEIRFALARKKSELGFFGEVKWVKVTANYQQKYIALIDFFFDLIAEDKIKLRVMFTKNTIKATNLTARHIEEKYFLLYYQFLKHAFGLLHCPDDGARVRVYLDKLPDTAERVSQFRSYLVGLSQSTEFRRKRLTIRPDDVAEVVSHEHDILQCLDVVLGAMNFRLNNKHLAKPDGQRIRGKRTIAKERVYQAINQRIRGIYPNFNIGISTGHQGNEANRWLHPYRHWLFVPKQREIVPGGKRD